MSASAPPLSPATTPDPLPVASTSSSSAPSPSAALSSLSPVSPPATAPQKKVVLLRRPSSPVPHDVNPAAPPPPRSRNGSVSDLARRTDGLDLDAARQETGEVGSVAGETRAEGTVPPLDPVLHAALNHPRDRILLLRAEVEMERFVASTSLTRLPLAPPHFQPGLNSYQRLLIHRLADMFGITREVEAAAPAPWHAGMINPATGQPQGVVVLVKCDTSRAPAVKLASYVPAPDVPTSTPALPTAASPPALPSNPSTPSIADSPAASVASGVAATTAPPPVFKILPRASASRGASSSAASSVVGEDDGVSSASTGTSARGGRGRRELTLVEREAAYKEARERIFSQPDSVPLVPATAPSSASASVSVASSVAGGEREDAGSLQSAGYGITRPSSAGSTFSRSSAALSVSGQRPPPSLVSESSSSVRSGYLGGGGGAYYHAQGQAQAPPLQQQQHYGGRPSFDPATGGWTYGQPMGAALPIPEYPYAYGPGASTGYTPPSGPYGNASYPAPVHQGMYDPSPPAWSRGLPSPALSSSSGGSSLQQFPPFPPPSAAGSDAGYLMRFPEGAVVTPGGGIVGPPAPYATASFRPSPRTAMGVRRSPEASLGGPRSEAGSSTGRSEAVGVSASGSGSGSGSASGSGAGSVDGRGRRRQTTIVAREEEQEEEQVAREDRRALHPSLPAKPAWVASQPPLERSAPAMAASGPPAPQAKNAQALPPQQPPAAQQGAHLPPYGFAQPVAPPQHLNGFPSAGFHSAPPPQPPGAGAWTRPGGAAGPLAGTMYGASASEYPVLHAPMPQHAAAQGYYAPPPPPPPTHPYGAWSHAAAGVPPAHVGAPPMHGHEGLLGLPEMRRPPPRNTQLFDPNKPAGAGAGGGGSPGGMRRGVSGRM